ncbi:MAG: anthranilate synthase component I, partial [Sphingomonadales bacterium]
MAVADFQGFTDLYEAGKSQIISVDYIADLDTPVSVYMRLTGGADYSFLLESVEGGAVKGRYSIIGFAPDMLWRCQGDKVSINNTPLEGGTFKSIEISPLDALRDVVRKSKIDETGDLPPAVSSLVGYMGYDMIANVEELDLNNPDPLSVP